MSGQLCSRNTWGLQSGHGWGASVLRGSLSLEAPHRPAPRARQQGRARALTITVFSNPGHPGSEWPALRRSRGGKPVHTGCPALELSESKALPRPEGRSDSVPP